MLDLFEPCRREMGEGCRVREPLGGVGWDVVAPAGPGGTEIEDLGHLGELDGQFVQYVGTLPVTVGVWAASRRAERVRGSPTGSLGKPYSSAWTDRAMAGSGPPDERSL